MHVLYLLYIVPSKVSGVDLVCYPVNLIVECNAEWDVRMCIILLTNHSCAHTHICICTYISIHMYLYTHVCMYIHT